MQLTSPAFANARLMPSKYTCKGENISPALTIRDMPSSAKSMALIMHDPDAPGGDWVHWTIWNIDPSKTDIQENTLPAGAMQGMTSFDKVGYGGPCPPSGQHRYIFELYALDTLLDLPENTSRDALVAAMEGHIIEQTILTGLFTA